MNIHMHARQKHIHFFKFNKLNVYIKCHDRKNSDFINLLYKYYIAYISFIISTLATNYSNNKHTVLQEKKYDITTGDPLVPVGMATRLDIQVHGTIY